MTHQTHFLKNSDKILVLNHGKGKLFTDFKEFQASKLNMEIISSVVKAKGHDTKLDLPSQYRKLSTVSTKSRASIVSNILDITLEDDHPELAEESRKKGSLSRQTYWLYFRSGAGITLASLVLIFNILSQLMFSANDIWLASCCSVCGQSVLCILQQRSNYTALGMRCIQEILYITHSLSPWLRSKPHDASALDAVTAAGWAALYSDSICSGVSHVSRCIQVLTASS